MHLHILGICGTFMGGIAQLALQAGHRVTGCDANVYPPMSTQLEAAGVQLIEGFDPDQRKLAPDLYVIGNVVSRGNPLMEAILDAGDRYVSGPQWLAEHVLHGRHVLAVAGTHGKTTTTSMLAWILQYAGLEPGFLVGGVPMNFGHSAQLGRQGRGSPFVVEADEYDTAFFDKRSKFVHYRPTTAILNNLEYDHADIFPDLAAIQTQFHHLVRTVPAKGAVVVNHGQESLRQVIARGCWSTQITFGPGLDGPAQYEATNVTAQDHFDVSIDGKIAGTVRWDITGEHNRNNALAAIAAASRVGVDAAKAIEALTAFQNVKRRMELRGTVRGIAVYDDFAHHPTAIATTLEGVRKRVGSARVLAVLEPRSNTMKLGTMKTALAHSLQSADLVFGYGAASGKNALGWDLGGALAPLGAHAQVFDDIDQLIQAIVKAAQPGDHVIVMSNGGFGGIHEKLLAQLALVG